MEKNQIKKIIEENSLSDRRGMSLLRQAKKEMMAKREMITKILTFCGSFFLILCGVYAVTRGNVD